MKILVVPDLHGRNFWRKVIKNYSNKVEKVIFLGDYLDPYQYEIDECQELMECNNFYDSVGLCNMLNEIISLKKNNPNKYILLTGNHVDGYIWPKFNAGTRVDKQNWKKYNKLFLENLEYFNLVWIENDVIFSHAGISERWAYEFLSNWMEYDESALPLTPVKECAEVLMDTPLSDFNNSYINALNYISFFRWGDNDCGSCEWADVREHIDRKKSTVNNIIPKGEEGIFQIFGHSQLKEPLITDKWICLDCRKGFIFDTNTHEITEC